MEQVLPAVKKSKMGGKCWDRQGKCQGRSWGIFLIIIDIIGYENGLMYQQPCYTAKGV